MIQRRQLLTAFPALMMLGVGPAAAALQQRSYQGRLRYAQGARERGRETFRVTIQPDGLRTLRAQCEIDDDQLLRDVTLTVDAGWRPVTAFIQLTIAGRLAGATWYRFTAEEAIAEGFTNAEGRISQRFTLSEPADAFGTHPIHGDAWNLARLRRATGAPLGKARFSSSSLANGSSGPTLVRLPENYLVFAMAGREAVRTAAGSWDADHFTMTVVSKQQVNHIWAFGEDCIPLRMTAGERSYELVELSGEPR